MADPANGSTGILKIDLDPSAMVATAHFQRSAEGDVWSVDKVRSALAERGIRDGIDAAKIGELIKRTTEGNVTVQVAAGTPVRQPVPETVAWAELSIPEELAEVAPRVLQAAPKAEINRQVTERVKREKEVEKKSALPFSKPKVEVVTVTETVTRVEKVYIDPTVEQSAYVVEGVQIGRVKPRQQGVAGLTVTGQIVPVKQLADPNFYAGDGITRRGEELIASRSGFLRVGRNWADVVPYSGHEWSVELSRDQATCYLTLRPGHALAPVPHGDHIRAVAVELPYPDESLIPPAEIDALIKRAIADRKTLENVPISLSRDASFDIFITEDKLQALLNIHKGKGRGTPLNLKEVGRAIKESGLRKLDFERIKSDINAFFNGPDFDLTGYLLCEGTAPTAGPERQIELAVRFLSDNQAQDVLARLRRTIESHPEIASAIAHADADAADVYVEQLGINVSSLIRFPAHAVGKVAPVENEQLIASIDPPAPGVNGVDVFGNTIAAAQPPEPPIDALDNITIKNNAVVSTSAGMLDYAEIEGRTILRIRPHKDALVAITVAPDRLTASVNLTEGVGTGTRLSISMVHEALKSAGVKSGVDDETVEKAVKAAAAGMAVKNLVVAKAVEPIHQTAGTIKWHIAFASGNEVRVRADGSADYRNQDRITPVEEAAPLCDVLPSQTKPVDGTDVTGQKIPAKIINGLPLEAGENVREERGEDGVLRYFAKTCGEVVFEKGRLDVRSVHVVKGNVDMHVGNIKFPGAVHIAGNVLSGFAVLAGGDIKIAGSVEAALLSADGDIMIKQGVKGAGKAVLRTKGRILTGFVELCTVLSVGDVIIKSASVRSRIKCNGRVSLGDKSRVLGGIIRARHGLEVSVIGSPRGVPTRVSFGQDYLIADLIEQEEQAINKIKRRITQIDVEMRQAEKHGNQGALEGLRREKVVLLKLLEKRGLRLFTLRERFEEHYESAIVVKEAVYSGTVFESHGRTYEITHPRKGLKVAFNRDTGNIEVNDLKNGS